MKKLPRARNPFYAQPCFFVERVRCSNWDVFRRTLFTLDGPRRLSAFWAPTGTLSSGESGKHDATALLVHAGYIRQSGSGVFHLLPLGLRVQQKIEALIDKHMQKLGAHKLALSSITSEALWKKSGRYDGTNPELFRLAGPKGNSGYLLSPTHEEEITEVVKSSIRSYKELPLRLYQLSRKYRYELRPRQGLLRAREFLMKDLYTFDHSEQTALQTYEEVKCAYYEFFNELKIPYLVAEADSGAMGGNLSHEFHFVTDAGEDNVMSCDTCSYVANEELAVRRNDPDALDEPSSPVRVWHGVARDGRDLVTAIYPAFEGDAETSPESINIHAVTRAVPDVDTTASDPIQSYKDYKAPAVTKEMGKDDIIDETRAHYVLLDHRVHPSNRHFHTDRYTSLLRLTATQPYAITTDTQTDQPLDLLKVTAGSPCPRCDDGRLSVQRAVELGHTFHLGQRYSIPLDLTVAVSDSSDGGGGGARVPLEMGCHGVGISRLIGAVAAMLSDGKGLSWPRVMAPFEVVVMSVKGLEAEAERLHELLCTNDNGVLGGMDVVLDDRGRNVAWKLQDADLIGYPVIVVVGKGWHRERKVEVQCRRLDGLRTEVTEGELRGFVESLLNRL